MQAARVGYVVGGLLLVLVAAPILYLGSLGAALGGALGGAPNAAGWAGTLCCVGLVSTVAGIILFIAGLVMKSKADLALMQAQTDYLRRQPPYPPPPYGP